MITFHLVSESGCVLIKNTSVEIAVLQKALSLKEANSSLSVLSEIMIDEKVVINCHQSKDLLVDICRLDKTTWGEGNLHSLASLLVECIDGLHLKIVITK